MPAAKAPAVQRRRRSPQPDPPPQPHGLVRLFVHHFVKFGNGLPGADAALTLAAVHTLAMLVVMAGVALLVYTRLGLAALRRYWINFDLLWALALLGAGAVTLASLLLAPEHGH